MSTWFGQWLYDWQTLIAGFLAVAAAFMSLFFLHRQINQAERHENTRRTRRSAAARASLPLTLAGIAHYTEAVTACLLLFYSKMDDETSDGSNELTFPPMPLEIVSSLERVVETAEDVAVAARVADLVSELQIFGAKLKSEKARRQSPPISKHSIGSLIVGAGVVHAYACSLFELARRESDTVEIDITWDVVFDSLKHLLWEHDVPDIWKTAQYVRDEGHAVRA